MLMATLSPDPSEPDPNPEQPWGEHMRHVGLQLCHQVLFYSEMQLDSMSVAITASEEGAA